MFLNHKLKVNTFCIKGCYEVKRKLKGNPVDGKFKHAGVKSKLECKNICQLDSECMSFNYHTTQQRCLLKAVKPKHNTTILLEGNTNQYFGPKYCAGNQFNNMREVLQLLFRRKLKIMIRLLK